MTRPPDAPVPVVAVGASAGGVEALWALLASLPHDLPAAVLVVMHLSPHAESRLPGVLARCSRLPAKHPRDGETLAQGQVYVAPPDQHLLLDGSQLRLTRGPRECRVRPAVDVLFRSVAFSRGAGAIAVVLSGTLDDGTAGLWAVKDRGGAAFVQDPAEAAYDSMPRSAMQHVQVDAVAPVAELARRIAEAVQRLRAAPAPGGTREVETRIAAGEGGLQEKVMELGKHSPYTCPECHGALTQIEEGPILRFRCHTGHAYSVQTLLSEIEESVDASLWNGIRALEEQLFLLEQVAARSQAGRHGVDARLERLGARIATLRRMLTEEPPLQPLPAAGAAR